jgi:hypothetical protein
MVTVHDGFVSFENYDRLTSFVDFDPIYLDQIGPLTPINMRSTDPIYRKAEVIAA